MSKNVIIDTRDIRFARVTNEVAPTTLETSHCHDFYEILFVVNGRGRYILEGAEIPVAPGTLLIARPLEYHCIKIEADQSYERYRIHFNAAAILPDMRALFDEAINTGEVNAYTAFPFSEPLISLFERFSNAESMPAEKRELYMKLILSELLMLLSISDGRAQRVDDGELGARVIKYLNENIERNISLDTLAKRFFVSKYYLCRAFKKHNGISVHGYINKKRVMLAKQLIESGETASGAAYRVGFGDYSAFYRAYVKVTGEPPSLKGSKRKVEEV